MANANKSNHIVKKKSNFEPAMKNAVLQKGVGKGVLTAVRNLLGDKTTSILEIKKFLFSSSKMNPGVKEIEIKMFLKNALEKGFMSKVGGQYKLNERARRRSNSGRRRILSAGRRRRRSPSPKRRHFRRRRSSRRKTPGKMHARSNRKKIAILVTIVGVALSNGIIGIHEPAYHHAPQPYKFGYSVKDHHGEQHREEVGDGGHAVKGSYGFTDDRGVHREVNYVADHAGFRAQVKTNEPGTANQDPAAVKMISAAHPYFGAGYGVHGGYGHGGPVAAYGSAGHGGLEAGHGYAGHGYGY